MGKNPVTASERRGVIAIAFLALLVTGAGLWLGRCGRVEAEVSPQEVEFLLDGRNVRSGSDSVAGKKDVSAKHKKANEKSGKKGRGKAGKKAPREYKDRSLLDEPVD